MDRYLHRRAVAGLLPEPAVWKDKSMGMLAPMPDSRWGEPVDLHHEAPDARLMRLVDPKWFRHAMDAAVRARRCASFRRSARAFRGSCVTGIWIYLGQP